jgi:hypothetical protein
MDMEMRHVRARVAALLEATNRWDGLVRWSTYQRSRAEYNACLDAVQADLAFGGLTRPPATDGGRIQSRSGFFVTSIWRDDLINSIRAFSTVLQHVTDEPSLLAVDKVSRDGIFVKGQGFDAFHLLHTVIAGGSRSIRLVDPYFDGQALKALTAKTGAPIVEVLRTDKQMLPATEQLLRAWRTDHGALEVRGVAGLHDRFLFVDDDVFHLGHSINGFGKGAFMFARIEQPELIAAARALVDRLWTTANVQAP